MAESAGPPSNLCYCTNVRPAASAGAIRDNLDGLWARVRELYRPGEPLGLGLWLPDGVSFRLDDPRFRLRTINAFPFGDFHGDVVKHAVYEPDWTDLRRSDYTMARAAMLMGHADPGRSASVSTVPLGWSLDDHGLRLCGEMLRGLAVTLDEIAERSGGRRATIDLEPEPGCALDTSEDVVRFFDEHLDNPYARAHIGVCHDVCHASVMFEDQREALKRYIDSGVRVNKVQVSSAPRVTFGSAEPCVRNPLERFHEERYLHQTCVRSPSGEVTFFEDLPGALARTPAAGEEWRTHFHVPVYLESLGDLGTTRGDILACMDACAELGIDPMWEVETYAWGVLPDGYRVDAQADGIARELAWTRDRLGERGLLRGET